MYEHINTYKSIQPRLQNSRIIDIGSFENGTAWDLLDVSDSCRDPNDGTATIDDLEGG